MTSFWVAHFTLRQYRGLLVSVFVDHLKFLREAEMDPVTGTLLLRLGLTVAGALSACVRRSQAQADRQKMALEFRDFIEQSTEEMEATIHAAVKAITDKIEQDQFELLLSRTRNLSALVQLNRPDQALHYAMTLRESVDYAFNRFREKKRHWLGPYLAGNSVFLASLEYSNASSPDEFRRFEKFVLETKLTMLDEAGPKLIGPTKKIPWLEISNFLHGDGMDVLPLLLDGLSGHNSDVAVVAKVPSKPNKVIPKGLTEQVTRVLKEHKTHPGLYLAPDIPARKLNNARASALVPAAEQILGLVDFTPFGSSSDCLVFGSRGLYFHHSSSSYKPNPGSLPYAEFCKCQFKTAWVNYIDFGDERYCYVTPFGRGTIIEILTAIKEAVIESSPS